jgi:hypothetical protein
MPARPLAAGFVDEGAKAPGCDAAYIAVPLLAELASAIGNSSRIRLKASWREPPREIRFRARGYALPGGFRTHRACIEGFRLRVSFTGCS